MAERPKDNYKSMARRLGRNHFPASAWTDRDIKALADLLRSAKLKGFGEGFNAGYSKGSDDQMAMRILDAKERKHG